jgi:prepilin peptidase CpaA
MTLLSLTLLVVIALAVRQDLTERRISNALTISGFAAALVIRMLDDGTSGLLSALGGAGVGLLCFLPLYLARGMGAGDVKLMGAAGAFLGPSHAFIAALLSLAAGALLALVVLAWRMVELRANAGAAVPGGPTVPQAALRKERFPYAVAIAIGVIATMWMFEWVEALVP